MASPEGTALDVLGVRIEQPTNQPVVLLRARGTSHYLPIWVAAPDAAAIAQAQQGIVPPRPLTHDLLKSVIESLGATLEAVVIEDLVDNVFHATLVFDGDRRVSARSSDGIALALRTGVPLLATARVLQEAAVEIPADEDDEVQRFREFLDHVSAEDFMTEGPTDPDTASGRSDPS